MKTRIIPFVLAALISISASLLFTSCAGHHNRVDHRDDRQDGRQDHRDDRQDARQDRF